VARAERTLERTAESRRDLTQAAADAADRLSPRRGDAMAVRAAELFVAGPPKSVVGATDRPPPPAP
jgi:hypothetical protein